MTLQVQDDKQFKSLLNALKDELISAAITFKLYRDLLAAKPQYAREMSQSWTFWSLTINALADSTVYRIAKAYDHHGDSLNLRNFLTLVQARPDIFAAEKFRERLKDNPFVDSLSDRRPLPASDRLVAHMDFVQAKSNPLVKRLVSWRDKFYAHRDPKHVLDPTILDDLLIADVETLINEGVKIINYYSNLYSASVDSTQIVGHEDFGSVLEAVRHRLNHYEAETKRQVAELQRNADQPPPAP